MVACFPECCGCYSLVWCCVVSLLSKDPICLLSICFHVDCKDMDFGSICMGARRICCMLCGRAFRSGCSSVDTKLGRLQTQQSAASQRRLAASGPSGVGCYDSWATWAHPRLRPTNTLPSRSISLESTDIGEPTDVPTSAASEDARTIQSSCAPGTVSAPHLARAV